MIISNIYQYIGCGYIIVEGGEVTHRATHLPLVGPQTSLLPTAAIRSIAIRERGRDLHTMWFAPTPPFMAPIIINR